MRWMGLLSGLLVVLVLQTAVVGLLGIPWIDLFLVLALLCGFVARAHDARLAAWLTGFVQDLASVGPLGVHAFALGVCAIVLTRLHVLVSLERWWARWLVAFAAGLPAQAVVTLHGRLVRLWSGASVESWPSLLTTATGTAAVAAGLAVLVALSPLISVRRRRGRRLVWR